MTGTTLGRYEILELLGKGGMGEVYRARDHGLDRDVAIKILPEEFAGDPARLARLEREAKVLARLDHPSIAPIHGLEEATPAAGDRPIRFLVMQCAEGETLADRITRAPIPLDDVLAIARQIAEGLEAAHEKGIVHRDLKPSNVKVIEGADGDPVVKILDFGLAKGYETDARSAEIPSDISGSPTVAGTRTGVILGTAAYMSPEQARGKGVDARTDVWAFGCVLYEMLTGRRAFVGETVSDTMAAILKEEPDWDVLPPSTPVPLRRLLRRCLRKPQRERLQHIGDARLEIDEAAAAPPALGSDRTRSGSAAHGVRLWKWVLVSGLAGVLVGAILVGMLAVPAAEPGATAGTTRVELILDPAPLSPAGPGHAFAVSPDRRRIVHLSRSPEGEDRLYVRELDSEDRRSRPLPIPAGTPHAPFFSPDGEWVGFQMLDGRRVMKLRLETGALHPIAEAVGVLYGAAWGAGGTVVFVDNLGDLWQVSEDGGTPRRVTPEGLEAVAPGLGVPGLLPDGRTVLMTVQDRSRGSDPQIELVSLETGARRRLGPGSDPRYVPTPTGHLVYFEGGSPLAAPFDLETLELAGPAVPLPYRVAGAPGNRWFDVVDSGWLFYSSPLAVTHEQLVWVDRDGRQEPIGGRPSRYGISPRLSPDGERVAFSGGLPPDIRVLEIATGRETSVMSDPAVDLYPVWTDDGRSVIYGSNRQGPFNLFIQPADGSGGPELLLGSEIDGVPNSLSPDGRLLAFHQVHPETLRDLWVLDMDERKPIEFLVTPHNERAGAFSPDGEWIAYVSDRDGFDQVYVKRFPDDGTIYQVSTDGGTGPLWGRETGESGREILYRRGNALMSARMETEPEVSILPPEEVFQGTYLADAFGMAGADLAPDGERLLMVAADPTVRNSRVDVVTDWFDELERVAPAGR